MPLLKMPLTAAASAMLFHVDAMLPLIRHYVDAIDATLLSICCQRCRCCYATLMLTLYVAGAMPALLAHYAPSAAACYCLTFAASRLFSPPPCCHAPYVAITDTLIIFAAY